MAIESNPFDTDEINAAIAECYADNYRNGFVPPHYPVPAPLLYVEYESSGLAIALINETEGYAIEWTKYGSQRLGLQ